MREELRVLKISKIRVLPIATRALLVRIGNKILVCSTHLMKEVRQEFSIVKSPDSRVISLYRFPTVTRALCPSEIRIKPTSKYTEIKVSFPPKNTSALKVKTLGADCITYKAFPTPVKAYYYTRIEGDKIVLYKVQNTYLFQAAHEYYPCDCQSSRLKKAESREEYEHRMKSINFKLKSVESEEFWTLAFRDCVPESGTEDLYRVPSHEKNEAAHDHRMLDRPVDLKQIEETIKKTRIVNLKDLLEIFPCESAVKTALFKMTDNVCGRFVLKNSYYEAALHEMRSAMLDIFRRCGTASVGELGFLGDERWLADELASLRDGEYVLRGHAEELDFDTAHVRAATLCLIKDLFARSRVLSASQISQRLSIDEDVVRSLVQNDKAFFHLSNDSYALDDKTYWLNSMFGILCGKKSFELPDLEDRLAEQGVKYQQHELIDEVKRYCSSRGNKYFLKIIKE